MISLLLRPSEAVILRIYGKGGGDLSAEASAKVGMSPSKRKSFQFLYNCFIIELVRGCPLGVGA